MKITPIQDRIVTTRVEADAKKGALFIPDSAKEKPARGIVRAVGPGRVVDGTFVETTIKVGDEILFGKYAGTEIEVDGETLIILREDEVLAKIEA